MIRVIVFLVLVGLAALGVGWLADRPGEVAITWAGLRIETSVMVLVAAVAAITVIVMMLWSLLRAIVRSPDRMALFLRHRRVAHGYQAISKGLVAIGAGDAGAARKFAGEAKRLAGDEPLALLLSAQSAQLAGNRSEAERAFTAMAARDDTKLLGLRGLYVEAQRRADMDAARFYAEEAARNAPALAWAGQAVLEFRSAAGDWTGALEALERARKSGLLDKAHYQRQRAVLLTARALSIVEAGRDEARTLILEAVKLAPTLVPAAALAGRLLAESGELRKASRIVERAWRENPHPDLADTYANLRFGDSARDRLKRVRSLAEKAPGHAESMLAVARAAIDAQEFSAARDAIAPLLAAPTRQVAILMAELEKAEHGDEGRARQWIARALHAARDPAWTADGFISERWMAVSPVSGRLDAFEWKVPLAEIAGPRPMPAMEEEEAPPVIEAVKEPEPLPVVEAETVAETPPPEKPKPRARKAAAAPRPEKIEAVIPLVHAPDDPGPEVEPEPEPTPEKVDDGWRIPRPFSR